MKIQKEAERTICWQDTSGQAASSPMAQLFSLCQGGAHPSRSLQVRCGGTERLAGVGRIVELKALTRFHHPPEFDLIAFSCAGELEPGPELLEPLRYCRLLLKPGGRLCLLLPGEIQSRWHHFLFAHFSFGRSIGRQCPQVALLIQAGFVDVRKRARPGLGRVISARRPSRKW